MRDSSHLMPLLLAIVLLVGLLLLIIPGGPLTIENDPPVKVEPSEPTPPAEQPGETTEPTPGNDPSVIVTPGDPETPNTGTTTPTTPSVSVYEYPIDVSSYLPAISYVYESILLVNKAHPLGSSFMPGIVSDLSDDLNWPGEVNQLEITAASALEAMLLCMRADGVEDIYVTSGYRSYQYQLMLQSTYINIEIDEANKNGQTLSRDEALAIVRTYSAAPGYSEHQSGLCVDLTTKSIGGLLDERFEDTAAFEWLQENACQFGFILRYPKDKQDVTGYKYEPWHYRFVGRDAAIAITQSGLTLEEYLAK